MLSPPLRYLRTFAFTGLFAASAGCRHGVTVQAKTVDPRGPAEQLFYREGDPRLGFIKTAMVQKGALGGITAATGRLAFDEDHTSRVGSPVSGRVENIFVKPGDRVKKGAPLVSIVSSDVEAALNEGRSADADLVLAQRSLERAAGLFAERAIAKKELVQAESDVVKASSNVERTRARLGLLGMRSGDHTSLFTLRAPVSGTVVERNLLPGTEVRSDAGGTLLTISELDTLWAFADIYERDLALVRSEQKAEIRVASYGDRSFPARVTHVGDVVDPQTRTVKVQLAVDNAEGQLKPEMFARVKLRLDPGADVIVVPRSAVLSDGESNVVIADLGGNRFAKRTIRVGSEQEGWVRINSGLSPGDSVVTEGALLLKAELENL